MGRLTNKKPNIPQVNLANYFYLIAGIPKAGKTSWFANFIEKYFGDINCGLLLATEKGYQALQVSAEDINAWEDFTEIVEELVDDKDKLPYKFIGIDTVDILWEMAQEEVIREWNQKNPGKRTNDIAAVGAKGKSDQGYGVGYQLSRQKVRKEIDKLMKAGYGVAAITHSKDKEIEQKDGLKYDQLVCSLPGSAREVFVNMADFVVFITIEKEKDGNDIVTKRYMYFRTDGYVEAGSRFANVPERIEYDVNNFIKTVEEAIRTEFKDGTDLSKIEKQQEKDKDKKSKEYIETAKQEKNEKKLPELAEEIKSLAREKAQQGKDIKKITKVIGNPDKYETTEEAQQKLDELKKLE